MKIYIKEETPSLNLEDRVYKIVKMSETIYPPGISTSLFEAEGDLIVGLSAGVGVRLPAPSSGSGQALVHDPTVSGKLTYLTVELTLRDIRNLLNNGGFAVAQRGTSFTAASTLPNNDDSYLIDQWILLSDGNDIVDVSQNALTAEQNPFYMRALVATANKKFGFLQIIEQKECPQEGESVSLSFRARTTAAAIRNVRAAVLSWDSTADAVTSDVVSAWNAEGSNPSLVANWTYENTPTDLALSTDWQTFTIEDIAVDTTGVKNLGVFIWCDDGDAAVNDVLDIEWVKLERGGLASEFTPNRFVEELQRCMWFYQKSWDYSYAVGSGSQQRSMGFALATANNTLRPLFRFSVEMKNTPTVTIYSYAGNANKVSSGSVFTTEVGSTVTVPFTGTKQMMMWLDSGTSFTVGELYTAHWTASAEL